MSLRAINTILGVIAVLTAIFVMLPLMSHLKELNFTQQKINDITFLVVFALFVGAYLLDTRKMLLNIIGYILSIGGMLSILYFFLI